MTIDGLGNKLILEEHLKTFNIYDLQRLLACFQYELTTKNVDKESVNEIIDCIKCAIANTDLHKTT